MGDLLLRYLSQYSGLAMVGLFGLSTIVIGLLVAIWLSNRKQFHSLSHDIPANVVKSHLDSVIQNSQALKSSLFRGGGPGPEGASPSVVPLGALGHSEEMAKKDAEISTLRAQVRDQRRTIAELEKKVRSSQGEGPPPPAPKEPQGDSPQELLSEFEKMLGS